MTDLSAGIKAPSSHAAHSLRPSSKASTPHTIQLKVNGARASAVVEPRTHLADFLREARNLTGTHLGCEQGVCGACTVLIDGLPQRSCITYAVQCEDAEVRTIEGFDDDPLMIRLRRAFNEHHALQCGFCTPGMLITARDIVERLPGADEQRIRIELSGNLCRCTGYMGIVAAIGEVLGERAGDTAVSPEAEPMRAPLPLFVATQASAAPAPDSASLELGRQTGTRIEDHFVVAHSPEQVWRVLSDPAAAAACLPGAEVLEHNGQNLKGRVTVKFGPMRASLSGTATVDNDEQSMAGVLHGAGTDAFGATRARADIRYRLTEAGEAHTRVSVSIEYSLTGPLAQFSRSGLVRDLVARMVADFAANLDARLKGGAATPPRADAGQLVLGSLWSRIKALFNRSQG